MHLWQRFKKPEYFYRPGQLIRRLMRPSGSAPTRQILQLPWGAGIAVWTGDAIGQSIWQLGVYDLTVSEILWRLTEPGETCLDVGANIGYMTSLLAARAGRGGTVHAFEPHPEIHGELKSNADRWTSLPAFAAIQLHAVGLSDRPGTATLSEPPQFGGNRGTSSLDTGGSHGASESTGTGRRFEVPIRRLDEVLPPGAQVGVAKVDVEGHELGVLKGAERLLAARGLRDIVFEDNDGYPGPVCSLLESAGYVIRRIDRTFSGPRLLEPVSATSDDWLPSSFLATLDPSRATRLVGVPGWQALAGRAQVR